MYKVTKNPKYIRRIFNADVDTLRKRSHTIDYLDGRRRVLG